MKYQLIIFDWDGTLMDSQARIVSCMQRAALAAGAGSLSSEAVRHIIGLGLPEAILVLCPSLSAPQREVMRQYYADYFVAAETHDAPMQFFPGVRQGLDRLHRQPGLTLAVATGKSRRGLDRQFESHACGHWFAASRTADLTESKPSPLMLEELLEQLNVPVDRALMVGDTSYDLEMAQRLGMDRVAMTYGVHAPEVLRRHAPVYETADFAALVNWIERAV
ncbi:HAD-IA family hydrolase [Larsenimonas rhizosphaerae]|uniref:HAD-IA family hydrolase n=1 Tax=Larsenimonas rhizosphaerae TaxID=2944682 RepID=UPI0020347B31|nr:HAD-IA family hydrolase [Larsenimonas rhizosphaerae]MCM2130969.1 HAD-IA family hydrolase [Larsenimonas rhizosphaerae]